VGPHTPAGSSSIDVKHVPDSAQLVAVEMIIWVTLECEQRAENEGAVVVTEM